MPKVTSVYYQRLETIPGKFANETYGCSVELEPDDTMHSAYLFARTVVNEQHNRNGQSMTDWKGMYERTKVQLENLLDNHRAALKNVEDMKARLRNASDLLDTVLEEIPF